MTSNNTTPPPPDWGRGRYERTAEALVPVAQAVIDAARPQPGEHVLDVGCGTGNVALMAAKAGARVTAVDPAPRLRDVTRANAEDGRLEVEVLPGDAAELPLPDHSVDAVLSNFAVIFAPDPVAAVSEMIRVLALEGRIVFSAWLPGDPLYQLAATAGRLVQQALGIPATPPPFPWHDPTALDKLFGEHGMTTAVTRHEITFKGPSAAQYLDDDRDNHPMAIAGFEVLQRAGQSEAARRELLRILEDGNEDPTAFQTTSHYVIATARR